VNKIIVARDKMQGNQV